MPFSRTMLADNIACSELSPDWIEQRIIRAYVQLAYKTDRARDSFTVTLARHGDLEIRLSETPELGTAGAPPFWLELRLQASGVIIDSLGCRDFDEDELSSAVKFVCAAMQWRRTLH